MRHLRFSVGQAFARIVVLVRTASGQMQATRLHREQSLSYVVTVDDDEALRFARAAPTEPTG